MTSAIQIFIILIVVNFNSFYTNNSKVRFFHSKNP